MRDVQAIKDTRDILTKAILKIDMELVKMRPGKTRIGDLSIQEQKRWFKLNNLKTHYWNQKRGLEFCLNEDSKLEEYTRFMAHDGIDLSEFSFNHFMDNL